MILEYLFLPAYKPPIEIEIAVVITLVLGVIFLALAVAHVVLYVAAICYRNNNRNNKRSNLLWVLSTQFGHTSLSGMVLVAGLIAILERVPITTDHVCAIVVVTIYHLTLAGWCLNNALDIHRWRWR